MYKLYIKRILDTLVSIVIIVVLMPFFLVVALCIAIDSKGPVFFVQSRVGKDFKTFSLAKFRTMTHEKREVGDVPLIGKAPGVTRIGYFLRRLKIDELPQLVNVAKGDMSLVGPRPSVEEQLVNMTQEEKLRYSVRPGMTGLAQVSGNIHIPWKRRYEYDLEYIRNITFGNDLRILLRTVSVLFAGEEKFKDKPLRLSKVK
jgi:lipopolysaccharide/colanic/teichoic acid biosynthesis glycosyltransferase